MQAKTPGPKFQPSTRQEKLAFLKLDQTEGPKQPKDRQDAAKDPMRKAQQSRYEGPFEIIDPIQTAAGSIGKWIPDIQHLPKSPSIVAFGKRRTGKSFSLRWIMYNCFRHIPFGCVFSHTSFDGFWQKYVPERFVFQGLPEHRLNALMDRQKKKIKKFRKEHPDGDPTDDPGLQTFVVLDDVIADKVAMMWNTNINSLFVEGRHLCITVLITSQHVKGVGPLIRGNMDLVVLQPIFAREARQTLADLYGGYMDRNDFFDLMDCVVLDENLPGSTPQQPKKRVRTMIINDFENTTDPQIKFKWLESEDPGDFKLCHPDYWKETIDETINQLGGDIKVETSQDIIDELDSVRAQF